ncbi:TIGR03118 family protein [Streptomyces sp. NPDC056227]|uniref:TIGR03118 family protein n=1 Tax=Streptomyces sp. NPDC056227 TaxID=3345753 RepID=UPI0035DBEBA8
MPSSTPNGPARPDHQPGPADLRSHLGTKLVERSSSDPWGLELAPKKFGKFSGDLLVGNFGDGHINVFSPNSGKFKGTLRNRKGNAIEIPGLWGLLRGTDKSGGKDSVGFAAGIDEEAHGLLGTLRAEH